MLHVHTNNAIEMNSEYAQQLNISSIQYFLRSDTLSSYSRFSDCLEETKPITNETCSNLNMKIFYDNDSISMLDITNSKTPLTNDTNYYDSFDLEIEVSIDSMKTSTVPSQISFNINDDNNNKVILVDNDISDDSYQNDANIISLQLDKTNDYKDTSDISCSSSLSYSSSIYNDITDIYKDYITNNSEIYQTCENKTEYYSKIDFSDNQNDKVINTKPPKHLKYELSKNEKLYKLISNTKCSRMDNVSNSFMSDLEIIIEEQSAMIIAIEEVDDLSNIYKQIYNPFINFILTFPITLKILKPTLMDYYYNHFIKEMSNEIIIKINEKINQELQIFRTNNYKIRASNKILDKLKNSYIFNQFSKLSTGKIFTKSFANALLRIDYNLYDI